MISASIIEEASERRQTLTISPQSEVMFSTPVTLTCRVRGPNTTAVNIQLIFGEQKHTATWSDRSFILFPKTSTTHDSLYPSQCRGYSDPDVTFCAKFSELSVRFKAVPALAAKVSCGIYIWRTNTRPPPVVKTLEIASVMPRISPREPRAGDRVKASCIFDVTRHEPEQRITGLEAWEELPDNQFEIEHHTFLEKAVSRNVTEADNGRTFSCWMGVTKRSKSLHIGARRREELTISPKGEVMLETPVKLTCRVKGLKDSENIQLIFGAKNHTATWSYNTILYPENETILEPLFPFDCRNYSDPDVTFCSTFSELSVQFKAVPALGGRVSCGILLWKTNTRLPPAVQTLEIASVFARISPAEPIAEQRTEASCFFDVTSAEHPEPKMSGLWSWKKLSDEMIRRGSRIFLKKTVRHDITPADNGDKITCRFGEQQKSKYLHVRMVSRAVLTISPGSAVLLSTLVTLTCRILNLNPAFEVLWFEFGKGKYTARLASSHLSYPTDSDSVHLPHDSCRDFSDPDVRICSAKSQLSVRFAASPALAGEVSCTLVTNKHKPPAKETLAISHVLPEVTPQQPRAGEGVEVSCAFDISGDKHAEPEMAVAWHWIKLPDSEFEIGSHTFLKKAFWRRVTAADNEEKVTCALGEERKVKTLNVRYPPILTLLPGDKVETIFVGSKISCSAEANPPSTEVAIFHNSALSRKLKARGRTQAEFRVPAGTGVGPFQVLCTAGNAENITTETRMFRVESWKIETPKGKEITVVTGGSFELACKLSFDRKQDDESKIAVLWVHKRRDVYGDTLLANFRSGLDYKLHDDRVNVQLNRDVNDIKTSMTFSNATVKYETHRMVVSCVFDDLRGKKFEEDMVVNIVFRRKVVTVPRSGELSVTSGSNFTLSCQFTFDPKKVDSNKVLLRWIGNDKALYATTGFGRKVQRVVVKVTRTKHYVTSSLKYLNANVERDTKKLLIRCLFAPIKFQFARYTNEIRVNIAYAWRVVASHRSLEVDSGKNWSLTCLANFDPSRVDSTKIHVAWTDRTHYIPLFETKPGRANSSRVKVKINRGAHYVKSSLTFFNATVERDSTQMTIQCSFEQKDILDLRKNVVIYIQYKWRIEIFSSLQRDLTVMSGRSIHVGCALTFDRSQLHSRQIVVTWRYWKSSAPDFAYLQYTHVSRHGDRIHSSLTFPTKEQHHTEDLIFECVFAQGTIYSQKKDIKIKVLAVQMSSICGRRFLFPTHPDYRILGGVNARPGEAPWHVYFRLALPLTRTKMMCSGSIIASRWILTTAHCFERSKVRKQDIKFIRVVAGNVNLKNDVRNLERKSGHSHIQVIKMKRVIIHEAYNMPYVTNDIALLELDTPLRFDNFTHPVCLPKHHDNFISRLCTASGFVAKGNSIITDMKKVDLPTMHLGRCKRWKLKRHAYKDYISEKNICTLYPGEKSTCPVSGGGPLVCLNSNDQFVQAGIMLWGATCDNNPSVYLKVAAFLPWIKRKTNITGY